MQRKKQRLLYIPPYWLGIWGSGLCSAVIFTFILLDLQPEYPKIDNRVFLLFLFILILYSCVNYEFYEDCMIVRLGVIPVRKVFWSNISRAIYRPKYLDRKGFERQARILLVIHPCQAELLTKAYLRSFRWHHPFKTLQFKIPEEKEAECLEVIKRYCGPVSKFDANLHLKEDL